MLIIGEKETNIENRLLLLILNLKTAHILTDIKSPNLTGIASVGIYRQFLIVSSNCPEPGAEVHSTYTPEFPSEVAVAKNIIN